MTDDDRHDQMHETAEDEIQTLLWGVFPNAERVCRAAVLIKLLHEEFMALDDADDVADIVDAIGHMVVARAYSDMTLFNPAGNA